MANTPPQQQDPLATMEKLSPAVYFSPAPPADQVQPNPLATRRQPKLCVLFTWMGASPRNAAKYLALYKTLFPSSAFLLVQSSVSNMTYPWQGRAEVQAAIDVFLSAVAKGVDHGVHSEEGDKEPEVFLQVMSNGGVTMFRYFREFLHEKYPDACLPPLVTLIDSAPSRANYWSAYEAFSQGISPLLKPLLHIPLTSSILFWKYLAGGLSPIEHAWPSLVADDLLASELRRVYVYGDNDTLIPVKEIEEHAAESEEKGFVVGRELFGGSGHCAHLRSDEARYRETARKLWEGA